MSYSGNSNGVGYRIDPYFVGSGDEEFRTNTIGGAAQTIYIAFDRDVLSFSVEARGASVLGATMVGYDVNGNTVDTKSIITDSLSPAAVRTFAKFFGRTITPDFAQYELQGSVKTPLRSIRIFPSVASNSLGMRNISLFSAVTPYQPPPVILTPGQNSNLSQTIDLATLVSLSLPSVERTYIKNTMIPIPSQELLVRNLSPDIDIRCGLRGASGVSFDPPTIDLLRGSTVTVNVLFDVTQINNLGEGTNTFTTILDLTTSTPILQAPTPLPPTPTKTPVDQKNKWKEERFNGAPFGLDSTDVNTILSTTPFLTQWVDNINYGDGNFPAPTTVRWKGTWTFEGARYNFTSTADDGIRVWIDNIIIIDDWSMGGARTNTRALDISAGDHDLRIEYFNGLTTGVAAFSFEKVVYLPPAYIPPDPIVESPTGNNGGSGGNTSGATVVGGHPIDVGFTDTWTDSNDGFRRYEE